MVALSLALSGFTSKKIMVIGDLLLDQYTIGKVKRISPEAPVPVLHVVKEEFRPGGVGNVALNLVSLGNEVLLVGQVGADPEGIQLVEALKKDGVDTRGVMCNAQHVTPVKNRMIASNQQIVRVDREENRALSEAVEKQVLQRVDSLMDEADIIAISDYAKGFLTPSLLSWVITEAKRRHIAVVVDPKGVDYSRYSGATLIKPNLSEAIQASGLDDTYDLDCVAEKLLQQVQLESLVVTRSEEGISVFSEGERYDFPTEAREVKDVTGAGDTVLAVLTMALANDLSVQDAARLSNAAASLAIEHVGCVSIDLLQLTQSVQVLEKKWNATAFSQGTIGCP